MALDLFHEMKRDGCTPNVVTYNALLDALGKSKRIEELLELHEEMLTRGCEANKITCNIVIREHYW